MSTESSSSHLTHTISLPSQPAEPVRVVAAPGVSDSDFRNAIDSSLFKQWLKNSETGMLVNGAMSLAQVLIQVRVPVGRLVLELPAGMLDDDKGDFVETAVREVEEEVGIRLNREDMVDLTAFLDPSTGCRFSPSPGGCDEEISLFLYRGQVDKEVIVQLQGKETGLREHGELITVHVVAYENLWHVTTDGKTLVAIALYEMAKKRGLLPPRCSPTADF